MRQLTIDNKVNTLGGYLQDSIDSQTKVSVIADYFTIFALQKMQRQLAKAKQVRLLLTENLYNTNQKIEQLKLKFLGDEPEITEKSKLRMRYVALKTYNLLKNNFQVRAAAQPDVIGSKIIVLEKPAEKIAINLSNSNLNSTGLGFLPSNKLFITNITNDEQTADSFLKYFNELWLNPRVVNDIKPEVLDTISKGFHDYSPEFIYYFTLHNVFSDYLDDLGEDKIVKSRTGFKDTEIWKMLYDFQRDGVLGAIDKIEKHGGCIIADSVGLGKTYEGLAVIKYYELRNDRVLVLCPKKLRENWTVYTLNDKRNILLSDRFNYDVLNHTDLSRDKGFSGEINLETVNWGNYDLVVIDESHNFRNNNPRKGIITRYQKLMESIIRSGVKTKVLMISATPVNNRMNDLKNQVAFITEGEDAAFEDKGIDSVHELMRKAQTQFNRWLKDSVSKKNVSDLVDTLDARYFRLLDLLTIARSRKHITKYYQKNKVGEFPHRLPPINIKADIDTQNNFPALNYINREIRKLNLSAYSPLKYVRSDKKREYSRKYDLVLKSGSIFKQIDREQSLIHLMRVNMLKRLESSIHSFGITISKLLSQIDTFLEKIQNRSAFYDDSLNIDEVDIDDEELEDYLIGNKIKVLFQDLDIIKWKQDLMEDKNRLTELLMHSQKITASTDAKLHELKKTISDKVLNPINDDNKKVLIFTAFADTAKYLYENLSKWASQELGIYSALVTGTGNNRSTLPYVKSDFNQILTFFSPKAKSRDKIYPNKKEEIDILIATDCISEGQNLQDCDFLVNYDIHWNPVRIIQRFGRIDRIGSTNKQIQLVNFWPNLELEEYINLEARVSGRMVLLDISATGEENIIDSGKEMNDLEYRKNQLERLQQQVIDLEEIQGGISITDLTFNDLKIDLMDYMQAHESELYSAPTSIHSVVSAQNETLEPGVVFCLRYRGTSSDSSYNPIEPYYIIHINNDGHISFTLSQSKRLLDNMQKLCAGENKLDTRLAKKFYEKTDNTKNMNDYTELLETIIHYIEGSSVEQGLASLFSPGGTTIMKQPNRSLQDFEVISFLIILPKAESE